MTYPSIHSEDENGIWLRDDYCDIFFGKGAAGSTSSLKQIYPHLKFWQLHQVHGCQLVEASADEKKSDAHWTIQNNIGLIIKSADCLPVMISHPEFICAIHAGWRGIQSDIIGKSLCLLAEKFGSLEHGTAYIGPHIQQSSFQVDFALAIQFQKQAADLHITTPVFRADPENQDTKAYLDLDQIASAQLRRAGISMPRIFSLNIDTVQDVRFQSYRRDRSSAGRNLSFVARRDNFIRIK